MKVAFHTNQLCLQGTEIALYDYAHFNEIYLGNQSLVVTKKNKINARGGAGVHQPLAIQKFEERFEVLYYEDLSELERLLEEKGVDVLYAIKKGTEDGVVSNGRKTVIHTVFKYFEPHGDVYAYVSQWLSDEMTEGNYPVVPHMIHLPQVKGDLREQLNIPGDAFVLGRYGGMNSFDIDFVKDVVIKIADEREDIHFVFMNTPDFVSERKFKTKLMYKICRYFKKTEPHPRIHFLPGTHDMAFKSKFINTCDVMLHARYRGETFGIAIGEFSIHNKPILTYSGRGNQLHENNHLDILKDKGLLYHESKDLEELIDSLSKNKENLKLQNWDQYSEQFGPDIIMQQFKRVFLS